MANQCGDKGFHTFEVQGVGADEKEAERDFEARGHNAFEDARKRLNCSTGTCEGSNCTFVWYWQGPKRTEKHDLEGLDSDGNAVDIEVPLYVCYRYFRAGCFCVAKKKVWL